MVTALFFRTGENISVWLMIGATLSLIISSLITFRQKKIEGQHPHPRGTES